jgi:CheY-like chemotaxis protein
VKEKIRVLLVDDEELFVNNMSRILRLRGFDVSTATDGYKAVDSIKYGGGYDVVVLDIKMPGMDGVDALREIKKWAPDTEVIMLTGHASVSSGARAIRRGAYDFLMKPCDIEDLVEKIREAYEAESIRRNPVLWPREHVREIALGSFSKLKPEDPLTTALEVMSRSVGEEAVDEVFVVDDEDRLRGVVGKRDLVNEAQKAHPNIPLNWTRLIESSGWLPDKPLKAIMRTEIPSIQANSFLTDAANQMIVNNVRRMPVIRAGKMIGIIRLQDVFQHLDHVIE